MSVLPDHDHKTMMLFSLAGAVSPEGFEAAPAVVAELLSAHDVDDEASDEAALTPREPAHAGGVAADAAARGGGSRTGRTSTDDKRAPRRREPSDVQVIPDGS